MTVLATALPSHELWPLLQANARTVRFRYEVLDEGMNSLGLLAGVLPGGQVSYNYLADIKVTLNMTIVDTPDIPTGWKAFNEFNFLRHMLQISIQFLYDGEWVSFPIGVFQIENARRTFDKGEIRHECKGYDLAKVLREDKFENRHLVGAGVNIVDAVLDIVKGAGIKRYSIPAAGNTMTADRSWDPGTSKMVVINELLAMVGYGSMYFDQHGTARSELYVVPADRDHQFLYEASANSVLAEAVSEELDLFNVPNKWVMVVSQPDKDPLVASFTNTSAESPTSVPNRGRTIVEHELMSEATDQATLEKKVRDKAHNASQVFAKVEFHTAIIPLHGENNVVRLQHPSLEVADNFSETEWQITMQAGTLMKHVARKVVDVG